MSTRSNRREFLGYLGLVGAGVGVNALAMRGLRMPLMAEPRRVAHTAQHPRELFFVQGNGAFSLEVREDTLAWRAFAPEPILHVRGNFKITLDNVHPLATLQHTGNGTIQDESVNGLLRTVRGNAEPAGLTLHWRVPFSEHYRFAAIGDSGGDRELAWVLHRAEQLGAHFLLHLGDLYYQVGDDHNVVRALSQSALPTYAAIGNHDIVRGFDRELRHWFERRVGPRNASFSLGGIQFINLDTAADTIPWSAGARGTLLRRIPALENNPGIRDYVVFTHRPITDLRRPGDQPTNHSIENLGEGEWLHRELLRRGARTIINGHIHNTLEKDDRGLLTYIAGEGMAHLDIVASRGEVAWFNDPQQRIAQILIGEVLPGRPVQYRWDSLGMPLAAHCNQRLRVDMTKERGHFDALLAHLQTLCAGSS